jgi:hypothetical protein
MGQQVVEEVQVADAEVGEGVVVDGDAAGKPAEGVVVGAEPGEGAGGADALKGRGPCKKSCVRGQRRVYPLTFALDGD